MKIVYDTVIALSQSKNVFNLRGLGHWPERRSIAMAVISSVLFSSLYSKNGRTVAVDICFYDRGYISLFLCWIFVFVACHIRIILSGSTCVDC